MENSEIARVFFEIADLLELKGGDLFRVRSYRNAGMVADGLPESLKSLYAENGEDGLKGIPGIGESTRAKIIEMLETGGCAYHRELLIEMPSGMLEILKVSGVGPKKAALIHKELGVKTIDELEKAASLGLIHDLPGFGQVSEEKILKGINDLKSRSQAFKLSFSVPFARSFAAWLRKVPGIIDIVPAGSYRRWKETIGDLDILTTCEDAPAVMERFVKHPEVREVVSMGETKSTVMLKAGLQVDIRVLEKKSFGAGLLYFTGSKAHNVALRDRAKRMGLKISEYGVFREDGSWAAGQTEEEVYAAVGLQWIPPELRENRGELEAAEKGSLPLPLDRSDIKGDLHVHTKESDGTFTMEQMAGAAMKLGYEYMAVTDHSKAVGIARGLDEARITAQMKAVDEFNAKLRRQKRKFTVLKATEVDIKADGTLDHPEEVLRKLDLVVASVHSGFRMSMDEMTKRVVKAIRTGFINILGHPTGRLLGEREPYLIDLEKVMAEAKKHNTALELNSYPDRLDLNDVHCMLAKEKGVLVAISTDSHSIHHLGNIEYGIHVARRGWLEKKDVLNTRPLGELMKTLKKK
ncbi:DNA polymerase/3'-5' exonuclease PolX [uncultured bacterium]|nr:DNA polymerase/3'-5' exonuclease PolX [uncultured bacterium]